MSEQTFNANILYGWIEIHSGFDAQGRGWGRKITKDRDGNVISDVTEFTGCNIVNFTAVDFGQFKPRTFWQWLTRQPRELAEWVNN